MELIRFVALGWLYSFTHSHRLSIASSSSSTHEPEGSTRDELREILFSSSRWLRVFCGKLDDFTAPDAEETVRVRSYGTSSNKRSNSLPAKCYIATRREKLFVSCSARCSCSLGRIWEKGAKVVFQGRSHAAMGLRMFRFPEYRRCFSLGLYAESAEMISKVNWMFIVLRPTRFVH